MLRVFPLSSVSSILQEGHFFFCLRKKPFHCGARKDPGDLLLKVTLLVGDLCDNATGCYHMLYSRSAEENSYALNKYNIIKVGRDQQDHLVQPSPSYQYHPLNDVPKRQVLMSIYVLNSSR